MAQETCQYCGDALAIETGDGWKCVGCGKLTADEDDGKAPHGNITLNAMICSPN